MIRRIADGLSWRTRALADKVARYIRRWRRSLVCINRADIVNALRSFGAFRPGILFVHSSLSACGHVNGGPAAVVAGLREWIGENPLAMPTHTYCYPDSQGRVPVFEAQQTRSLVGAVTDYYWRQPGVVRSLHPTHSLACNMPAGEELCRGHELRDTPCGPGTPYARLVEQDCAVLMFGVTLHSYTLFHTAEDAAQVPYLYEPAPYTLRLRDRDDTVRSFPMWRQDARLPRRFAAMDDWLEGRRLLVRRRLGRGELLLLPHARAVHQTVVEELRVDPLFLVEESARAEVGKRFGI
jgi:aminoglycoside 3-N-acetyltransferase